MKQYLEILELDNRDSQTTELVVADDSTLGEYVVEVDVIELMENLVENTDNEVAMELFERLKTELDKE